jgi:NAD(P)-dependent dehydrogenase (short-subunit alcohol dehydrogenase family)
MDTKVALVTGASSGIGESAAIALHKLGYTVYAGARRVERMTSLAARGIRVVALDVTDDASMIGVVDTIMAESGRIDVLVNNAGYGSYGSVEDVPMSEARQQIEVNLFGLARMTQLVVPQMRTRRSGRIINVSSIGGRFGEPLGAWYHASKFAVEGFSDSLRLELQPFDVQVVIIEPGAINTEWGGIALDQAGKYSEHSAYAGHVRAMSKMYATAERSGAAPGVVADVIVQAATAKRPKLRYAAPFHAKVLMLAVRVLPARTMDAIMRQLLGGPLDTTASNQPQDAAAESLTSPEVIRRFDKLSARTDGSAPK